MAAPKDFFQLVAMPYWLLPDDLSKVCRRWLTESGEAGMFAKSRSPWHWRM
jgi:hypothetical protein